MQFLYKTRLVFLGLCSKSEAFLHISASKALLSLTHNFLIKSRGDSKVQEKQIISNKHVKLEIELILNRKLFQNNVIEREIYEEVQDELLKEINREIEKQK